MAKVIEIHNNSIYFILSLQFNLQKSIYPMEKGKNEKKKNTLIIFSQLNSFSGTLTKRHSPKCLSLTVLNGASKRG